MGDDQSNVVIALQRRLALLRERAAKEGAHTDPAVQMEIEDIAAQLHAMGAAPRLPSNQQRPWWASVAEATSGDVIVGQVGAGAQNVAVGKHIQQAIGVDAGATSDRVRVEALLAAVEQAAQGAQLDAAIRGMVMFQLELLRGELSKPNDGLPSASTITRVGDWLLDHAPALREPLGALWTSGAGWRLLACAGDDAVAWAAGRFGESA